MLTGRGDHPADHRPLTGVEVGDAGEVALPAPERPHDDPDDDQQAGQLHAGEQHVGLDALPYTPVVDRRDQAQEAQPDQGDAYALAEVEADHLGEVGTAARAAVDAEVMPELITAKATMKVRKCTPNALCA